MTDILNEAITTGMIVVPGPTDVLNKTTMPGMIVVPTPVAAVRRSSAPPTKSNRVPERLAGTTLRRVVALLYGDPGVGKTTLAASAPRPLFAMCDPEGEMSIASSGHLIWRIQETKDAEELGTWLVNNQFEYDSVVWDSITQFQHLGMDVFVDPEELKVTQPDWGMSFRQLKRLIDFSLKLHSKNIIFIASERLKDDKVTKLKVLMPSVTPAVANYLNLNVRLIGRLSIRMIKEIQNSKPVIVRQRVLQVRPDGQCWAKDTSGKLPNPITSSDLDLSQIFKLMGSNQVSAASSPSFVPVPEAAEEVETEENATQATTQ